MPLYGGFEVGGTRCACAVGTAPDDLQALTRFDTTTPEATLTRAIEFFAPYRNELSAVGIGAFGPLDLHPDSPSFGAITSTPKPDWAHTDVVGRVRHALDLPVALDTDVNAAALGEYRWGAAHGLDTFVYLTVGTGIGGGVMANGRLLHGLLHPEMGHMRIPHDHQADPFVGLCPYHGDCLEGLASGPAMAARWGQPAQTLPPEHAAWTLQAHYLALGLTTLICTLAPQRLILGGGVMQQQHLFAPIRHEVQTLLNHYIQVPALGNGIDIYIVPPGLGDRAGVLGAMALAEAIVR